MNTTLKRALIVVSIGAAVIAGKWICVLFGKFEPKWSGELVLGPFLALVFLLHMKATDNWPADKQIRPTVSPGKAKGGGE